MKKILVTGANGQLGKCIKDATLKYSNLHFLFASKEDLDIEDMNSLKGYFSVNKIDYCINAAAYTHVENAESDSERAFAVNAEAVKNLVLVCRDHQAIFLQVSTDYVFDGKKRSPYIETDKTNPINVYGASKLKVKSI